MEVMEIKVIAFWATLTCLAYIVARMVYIYSNTNLNWKYWKGDHPIGIIHSLSLVIGGSIVVIYLIIKIGQWWFA